MIRWKRKVWTYVPSVILERTSTTTKSGLDVRECAGGGGGGLRQGKGLKINKCEVCLKTQKRLEGLVSKWP